MRALISSVAVPLLRVVDPERAHGFAIRALAMGLGPEAVGDDDPRLTVTALGLRFSNPIGLAAGFDKNAEAGAGLLRLGFGFVETGTVTLRPQTGNPRPRMFRLTADRAAINRLGFNNKGIDAYVRNLARQSRRQLPLGANIGINKEGADPAADYPALVRAVAPLVDYVVINVSSPNTPGLRDLQSEAQLRTILQAVAALAERPPILVKVAPDLSDDGLAELVEVCAGNDVTGLIVSNTTVSRPGGLVSPDAREAGGLSGAPLRSLSTRMLARAYQMARGRLTLIGVGGVFSGADVLEKIQAGATLVQLYTSFAYYGPALIPRLKRELLASLDRDGVPDVTAAVGRRADALAEQS
ncbi:MAG TPA: quinone-dependent dihydroorotate dehydrogenase [Rhodopila sp.]|nr:quinone-dependent dihydroorotate dehydrogenase [Rhodopila sp.]